jgi:hypothetical protein
MSSSPRYRQIADDLRRRLEADGFQVGDKLPPIAELQKRYGCENNLNMIRTSAWARQAAGRGRTWVRLRPRQRLVDAYCSQRLRELEHRMPRAPSSH